MGQVLKSKEALDRRDRRLMHKIWQAAVDAIEAQKQGHTHKWQALQDALDKAEDEMGPPEEYEVL